MNVLSLFDGMSCGMIALAEMGTKVDRYAAYEIDKYAIKTSKYNFPQIEQKGDVFEADFSVYKDIDLLCGGSPCTSWSIAQKKDRETESSGIGWDLFCYRHKRANVFIGSASASRTGGKTGLYAFPVNASDGKSRTIKAQYAKTSIANICKYESTYGARGVAEAVGYAEPCEWDTYGNPIKAISNADGKAYKVYKITNGQINVNGVDYPIKLDDGYYIIRKLTVTECMRLQTVPEWYKFPVSDTQAYNLLGNGWTVDVIKYLISHMNF